MNSPKLTANVKAGGCASKLAPGILDRILSGIPRSEDPNVLVGFDHNDDAGVYLIAPGLAIAQTIDFFSPMVDDPATFGAIAAANALSDIYAMGGRPISALTVLACPAQSDFDEIAAILHGGAAKMSEACVPILGGHSVTNDEIKFGYAVTGSIDPDRIVTNAGALPGDILVFTKALGTGIITTALKRGVASPEHIDRAISSMLHLNREASAVMLRHDAHACTDVTGFGLLGHAREMAIAAGVTLEIDTSCVEALPGALEYALQGTLPGGLHNNREFVSFCVESAADLPPGLLDLLYDPQTSGGLLVSLQESAAESFLHDLPHARRIGRVLERQAKPIRLL